MKLKTYTAETMAQALAQVRKDLGANAMILHTRSFRTGSWLGIGGKAMVEITASSPQPTSNKPRKTRKAQRASQAPVAIESKSNTDQSLQENHIKDVTDIPDIVERKPAPNKQQTNQQANTQSNQNAQDTKQRMTEIKDALSEAQRTTEELTKASTPKPTSSSSEQLDDRSILLQGLMGLDRKNPTIDREPQQD
ncbi:MAG: hypothetical protein JJ974_11870, partial [Phycisphaerales bacterium]|nr:hypothetical protein [Phycisphaerales bacterium]